MSFRSKRHPASPKTTADVDAEKDKSKDKQVRRMSGTESNPKLLEWLALQDTTALRTDVHVTAKDRKAAKNFEDIEKDRLEQATKLRPWFFGLAAGLALLAVLTSSAMVIGVVFWDRKISDALGVAFVSSLAVETLGILTIVGTYLFSHPPAKDAPEKAK